jgi:hypothetical protein
MRTEKAWLFPARLSFHGARISQRAVQQTEATGAEDEGKTDAPDDAS